VPFTDNKPSEMESHCPRRHSSYSYRVTTNPPLYCDPDMRTHASFVTTTLKADKKLCNSFLSYRADTHTPHRMHVFVIIVWQSCQIW